MAQARVQAGTTRRKPKWRRRRDDELIESARPFLEPGEEVRGIYQGQSLVSPWLYLLVLPLLLAPVKRRRTMVVTDRNVYQFAMRAWSGRRVKAVLQETSLPGAVVHEGMTSLKVDDGPRLYATPDSGRGVRRETAALIISEADAAGRSASVTASS